MAKIAVIAAEDKVVTLASMPVGSYGILKSNGKAYYRTADSAICLDNPGASYTGHASDRTSQEDVVTLLKRGWQLVITIE